MSIEIPGASALDIEPCRYGASKLVCRGPLRRPEKPYFAFLGDGETFGKFVKRPFAGLVELATGQPCINLGGANMGIDAYLADPDLLEIAANSETAVVQAMGPQNLTNRFYRVHPRRNDRFVAPEPALSALYPELDFTEFSFNRHLLSVMRSVSLGRFSKVESHLKQTWTERMQQLCARLGHAPLLLWLRYDGAAPLLIDRPLVDGLTSNLADVVEVHVTAAGDAGEMPSMHYGPLQAPAAARMIGPSAHRAIAEALLRKMKTPPRSLSGTGLD